MGRDVSFVAAELKAGWCRDLWNTFAAQQLATDPGNPKLRCRVEHAAEFFRVLDRTFEDADDLRARSLDLGLDSRLLRKHLIASRFIVATLRLDIPEDERQWAIERRRATAILARAAGTKYGELLRGYAARLAIDGVATRTARLYLRAAEAFCAHAGVDGSGPWREERAVRYLKASPGQAASLARFIGHCHRRLGWDVSMPSKELWKSVSRQAKDQVKALAKALRAVEHAPDSALTTRRVARVLSLAVGVPAAQLLRERVAGGVVVQENGAVVVTEDAVFPPTHSLYRYAFRWAHLGQLRASSET